MRDKNLVTILLFFLFFTNLEAQPTFTKLGEGQIAPKWALASPNGINHSLNDYRDKIVVLDFWATWCGPCRQQMPKLQKVHENFSEKDVAVIGISTWEKGEPGKFMSQNDYNYQLLIKGEKIAEKYKVSALPTLYIINRDRKIIYSKIGGQIIGYKRLANIIKEAL